jgi:hypothetical protein
MLSGGPSPSVSPHWQRLPDSTESCAKRGTQSRRIRWRRRSRSDKRQPRERTRARPRSPSRRRRPRAGSSTATCVRRARPLPAVETQTPDGRSWRNSARLGRPYASGSDLGRVIAEMPRPIRRALGQGDAAPTLAAGTTDARSQSAAVVAHWAKNAETEARYWAGRQRVSVRCALCRKQLAEGVSLASSREILDRHLAHAHPEFTPRRRKQHR